MAVNLMLTCLCDAFYGEVGVSTVRVLEACGVRVEFLEEQTCCGQPPFNAGNWVVARSTAERCRELLLQSSHPIVVPSGSCAAMLVEGYRLLLGESLQAYELSQYLFDVANVRHRIQFAESNRVVVFHSSCHGRAIHVGRRPIELLHMIPGLTVLEPDDAEQCCGFGGSFSVTHPHLSEKIGLEKLSRLVETGADTIVSGDMGCLMHLKGLLGRQHHDIRAVHWIQLLDEAMC